MMTTNRLHCASYEVTSDYETNYKQNNQITIFSAATTSVRCCTGVSPIALNIQYMHVQRFRVWSGTTCADLQFETNFQTNIFTFQILVHTVCNFIFRLIFLIIGGMNVQLGNGEVFRVDWIPSSDAMRKSVSLYVYFIRPTQICSHFEIASIWMDTRFRFDQY